MIKRLKRVLLSEDKISQEMMSWNDYHDIISCCTICDWRAFFQELNSFSFQDVPLLNSNSITISTKIKLWHILFSFISVSIFFISFCWEKTKSENRICLFFKITFFQTNIFANSEDKLIFIILNTQKYWWRDRSSFKYNCSGSF